MLALMGVAPQCWSDHLVRRRSSEDHDIGIIIDEYAPYAPQFRRRALNLFPQFAKRVQREYSNWAWFIVYLASGIHWDVDSTSCVVLQSYAQG